MLFKPSFIIDFSIQNSTHYIPFLKFDYNFNRVSVCALNFTE